MQTLEEKVARSLRVRVLFGDSLVWGTHLAPAVIEASTWIRDAIEGNRETSYSEVLGLVAQHARKTAEMMTLDEAAHFGIPRTGHSITAVSESGGKYSPFFSPLRAFVQEHGSWMTARGGGGLWRGTSGWFGATVVVIGSPVSALRASQIVEWPTRLEPEGEALLLHSPVEMHDRGLELVDRAFAALLRSSRCVRCSVCRAIRIFWMEANLNRFRRGSLGIADAMLKSTLLALRIPTLQWRSHISPDFEAFIRDARSFGRAFPLLLT